MKKKIFSCPQCGEKFANKKLMLRHITKMPLGHKAKEGGMKPKLKVADAASTCLRPGCTNNVYSRGLCLSDYTSARRLIRLGKITEGELVSAGRILPAKYNETIRTKWLMDAKEAK